MPVINNFVDQDALAFQVASHPEVISRYAGLADKLGFGWCGGTGSKFVGQDFSQPEKSGTGWHTKANYRDSDHPDGYWSDRRLEMWFDNFKLLFKPDSIHLGDPTAEDLKPLIASTSVVENRGAKEDTFTVSESYQQSTTATHTTETSFTEKLSLQQEFSFGLPGVLGGDTTITFEFSSTQGWSDSTAKGETVTQTSQIAVPVPATSKVLVSLMANNAKISYPYTAEVEVSFEVKFHGFLRWSTNAMKGFPRDRPTIDRTFGHLSGDNPMNAHQHMRDLYKRKDIPMTTPPGEEWDFDGKSGSPSINDWIVWFLQVEESDPIKATITGNFTQLYGKTTSFKVGEAMPLDSIVPTSKTAVPDNPVIKPMNVVIKPSAPAPDTPAGNNAAPTPAPNP